MFCLPAVGKHNHNIRVSSSGHLGLHPDPTLIPPSQQKCCPSSQERRRKGCCEGKDSNWWDRSSCPLSLPWQAGVPMSCGRPVTTRGHSDSPVCPIHSGQSLLLLPLLLYYRTCPPRPRLPRSPILPHTVSNRAAHTCLSPVTLRSPRGLGSQFCPSLTLVTSTPPILS